MIWNRRNRGSTILEGHYRSSHTTQDGIESQYRNDSLQQAYYYINMTSYNPFCHTEPCV